MGKQVFILVKGIIIYDGKVLILKRASNKDIGAGNWEFVGGNVNFNEELEEALLREIREETSMNATIEKILYATNYKTSSNRNDIVIVYKCHTKDDHVKLSEEHTDYRWVSEEELRKMLYSDIVDALKKYNIFSQIF